MPVTRETFDLVIEEQTTPRLTFTLKDEDGNPVPKVALTSATLTLYESIGEVIVNGRSAQDVLTGTSHGVTIGATNGVVTWYMSEDDMEIIGSIPIGASEIHVAEFRFEWLAGSIPRGKTAGFEFEVENYKSVVND